MSKPKRFIVSAYYRDDARQLIERREQIEAKSAAAAREAHAARVLSQDGFPILRTTAEQIRAD